MSKGSKRRPTDDAAFAEGFDRIFRNKTSASSPNGKAPGSTPEDLCSNQSEAANVVSLSAGPTMHYRMADDGSSELVYVDDATGKMVDEDFWP